MNISNNEIIDVSPLENLEKLDALNLSNNQISNVVPLSKLINLNMLNLAKNKISDISSFSLLTNLNSLYLEENKIMDVSALNLLKNLEDMCLYNQYYEYNVAGNVLGNIKTNINLPTFFIQAKKAENCNYTSANFTVSGATLAETSTYIVLQNSTSGKKTVSVKINGGNADGSTMVLTYNNVIVAVTNNTSTPTKIYERNGGTLSFVVNNYGDTSTNNISILIIKKGTDVTNNFHIEKSVVNYNSARYTITVPASLNYRNISY